MTDDQKHWRNRATKMRSVAVTMADTHAGILLNDLAHHYDELANQAACKDKVPLVDCRHAD
jgi:hypothetical protein